MPPLTLFLSEDVKKLLHNKFVVIIGDSIQRGIYKDLIALLQGNEYLSSQDLKGKGEKQFMNDELLEGGNFGPMTNGTSYREVRQYSTDFHLVRFYFVTRVYNKYWEHVILPDLKKDPVPDVVMMNSCLWDISRYGRNTHMDTYKKNIEKTFCRLNSILPLETLIMWNSSLPVSVNIKGGFLIPELQTLSTVLRMDVREANFYSKELAKFYEIDVLDLHYYFRNQMHRQAKDGTHWNYVAHRRITNLILAHIAVSWGVGCPRGRVPSAKLSPQKDETETVLYTDFEKPEAPVKLNKESEPEQPTQPLDAKSRQSTAEIDGKSGSGKPDKEKKKPPSADFKPPDANSMHSLLASRPPRPDPGSGDQLSHLRASIDQTQELLELLQDTNAERGKTLKNSREVDRPTDRSDGGGDSQRKRFTPPLPKTSLPTDITLKPIDVGISGNQSAGPPLLNTPHHLKEHAPRVGNRFQPYTTPYAQPPQPYNQPAQPYSAPAQPYNAPAQPYNAPAQPYNAPPQSYNNNAALLSAYLSSQPQAAYFRNMTAPRPYAPQPNRPYLPQRQAPHSYSTPYNIINPESNRAARAHQRILAEREMEIARGLIAENMLRLG